MTSSYPSGGGSSSTADPLAFLRPSLSGRGGPPPPSRRPPNSGGLSQPSGSHRYGSTFDNTPSFRRLPGNSISASGRRDQPMGSLATDFHVPPPTSKMILSHSYGFNTERPSFHQPPHREHDLFARGRPHLPEPSSSSSSFYRKPPSPRGREIRGTSLESVMGGDFARRPPPSFPSDARGHDVGRSGGFRSFRDFPESRGRSRSPLRRSFKEDLMPLIPLPSRDPLARSFTSERRFRSRSPRRSPTPPPFRGSPDRGYGAPRFERDRNGDPTSRFFDSPPRRPLSPAPPLRAPPPRVIDRFDPNPPRYRRPSLDSVVGTRFRSPERSVQSREFRPSDSWRMNSPRRQTRFPSPSPRASSRENRSRSKGRRRSPTRDRSFMDKKSEPVRATPRSHRHASKPPPKDGPGASTPRKDRKSPPRRARFEDPGSKSKSPNSQNTSSHPKSRKESRSSVKSNASNSERTRDQLSNDRDEKSRVSALKRLGPKLGVTERLGPKTAKNDDPKSKGGKDRAESAKNHDGPDMRSKEDDFEVTVSCTPCGTDFPSSKQFLTHLHSNNHKEASKGLKNRLQVLLTTMRQTQRERQKKLEKELASTGQNVDPNGKKWPTVFCKTCKIFLSQKKSEHNKCEMHLLISSFLNPRCPPCDAQFTSPMAFERHVCTVPHLKALSEWASDVVLPSLAVIEKQFADISDKPDVKEPIVVTLDEDIVVDLDPSKSPDASTHTQESTVVVEEAKSKLDPNTVMGPEYVKPVEMYFCDLCHKFLPRPDSGNAQNLIDSHCKSESHQKKVLEEHPKEATVLSNESSSMSQSQPRETGYSYADDDNVLDFEADSVDGDI